MTDDRRSDASQNGLIDVLKAQSQDREIDTAEVTEDDLQKISGGNPYVYVQGNGQSGHSVL
jgi:bacteriocin-like protein